MILKLGFISALNIVVLFFTQIMMFSVLGVSDITDVYIIFSTIAFLISSVVSGILNNLLVPYFSVSEKPREVFYSTLIVVTFFSLILKAFAMLVTFLWSLNFNFANDELRILAYYIGGIQSFVMFFTIIYSVIWSYINSRGLHFKSEIWPFLINLISLPIAYYGLLHIGIITMPLILLFRVLVILIIQLIFIDFKFRDLKYLPHIKDHLLKKIKPILLTSIYYKSEVILERSLLSIAPPGTISIINLVQQIVNACIQVVHKAYNVPATKRMADIRKLNLLDYKRFFYARCSFLILFLVFGYLFILNFPEIIYYALYFSDDLAADYEEIYYYFIILYGVLFANCLASLINSSFYIFGDTKTPSIISCVTYTIYIPIKIFCFYYWGLEAMIISSSLYSISILVILFLFNQRVLLNARN